MRVNDEERMGLAKGTGKGCREKGESQARREDKQRGERVRGRERNELSKKLDS